MRRESDPSVMLGFVFVYMMVIILIVLVVLAAIFLID
jgi:hypothetical protein